MKKQITIGIDSSDGTDWTGVTVTCSRCGKVLESCTVAPGASYSSVVSTCLCDTPFAQLAPIPLEELEKIKNYSPLWIKPLENYLGSISSLGGIVHATYRLVHTMWGSPFEFKHYGRTWLAFYENPDAWKEKNGKTNGI